MRSTYSPTQPPQSINTIYDTWLLIPSLSLLGLGLLIVASASMVISEHQFGHPFHFLIHQLIYLVISLMFSGLILKIEIKHWQSYSHLLLAIGILLLLLVLTPGIGKTVNGSKRWINLGIIRLQASEFMKLFFIVYLSDYLTRHSKIIQTHLIGFLKPLLLLSFITLMLMLEPDFGAASVIIMVTLLMLFLAKAPFRYFLPLALTTSGGLLMLAISAPYRFARITSFLNPWNKAFESGYQLTQSLMAFGRGGIWGAGLGNSIQKLFYLPEAHTDFLFAVLAEELGLIGQVSVCLLFITIVYRALWLGKLAQHKQNYFAGYLAYGISLWIGLQSFVNMGVNLGILPTKGLTLPLMSYGGSSLLVSCMAVALLLRLSYETRR